MTYFYFYMYANDMNSKIKTLFLILCVITVPAAAAAHPADQALAMLLPTELYALGGTLTVAASILLMGFLPINALEELFQYGKLNITSPTRQLETISSLFALVVFFALILIGFFGPNDPQSNLLPLFIWTGWWVGVFIVQGLFFDIWRFINPWTGLTRVLLANSSQIFKIPKQLGQWPAVVVFLSFQLFMLADIAPNDPSRLTAFVLGYWLFTFFGIVLFGTKWLRQCECFSVLFQLIGSLRVFQTDDNFRYGIPGWASIATTPLNTSRAVFCLMILISGSFDGLQETFWWLGQIGINPLEFPGRSVVIWSSIMGLFAANIVGVSVYALSILIGTWLVRKFGNGNGINFMDAFNTFAIAILPIAFGYHFAHYFVSFLIQVQYLVATIADPLAKGWNLFGLGRVTVTTGFLKTIETVRPILLTTMSAVVLSHVLSVIMAHRLAGCLVSGRRNILLIQCGLSLLMILYTTFGLWLLSAPRGA